MIVKITWLLMMLGMRQISAAKLANEVIEVAQSEPALFDGDDSREKTARTLATWAFFESSGRADVMGDIGQSCGVMQLSGIARKGHTCSEILRNRVLGLRLGLRFMHFCAKKCGDLRSGLVAYASGKCDTPGVSALVNRRLKRAGVE